MKFYQLFIITLCLSLVQLSLSAQRGWEAGPWGGVSHYFGDLNTDFDLGLPGIAGGLAARYNFNERLCLKFAAGYGTVYGDDARSDNAFERARNLSFQSSILDGTAQLEFNFLTYVHGSKDQFFSPYVLGGFSVFSFNPMAAYDGEMVELRPLGTEGQFRGEEYYSTQGAFTYGVGLKIALNYEWSINLELGMRQLFSDYLDDVSTTYPDMDDLENLRGPIAVALSDRSIDIEGFESGDIGGEGRQRGNASNNDSYSFLGISILYYFGDLRCPDVTR